MTAASRKTEGDRSPTWRWRVVVALPPPAQFGVMCAWLDEICGPAGWAAAPTGTSGVVNDALAFYFADSLAARAFVARFSCGYRCAPPHRV